MNEIEAWLRILSGAAWAWVAVYNASGAWAAARGHETHINDPKRLAWFLTGLLFLGFNLRWLFLPGNESALIGLLTLSLVTAVLVWRLGVAYGRGPVV